MTERIRVVQYGLGPIGSATARLLMERDGVELVAGVDVDPEKVGRDVGEVIRLGSSTGFPVVERLGDVDASADVVVHTTASYFPLFLDQVLEILEAGLDVVSTSEEMAFPWRDHRESGERVDQAAKAAGKTVLGTGVNPGFLLDSLPLFLTSICQQVERIEATRFIDASVRRGPFQAKIGSGLTVDEFNRRMESGRMGHVGLPESMAMIFDTLGKKLVRYESVVVPRVAATKIETEFFSVEPGLVCGLQEVGRGFTEEGEFATLTFIAALDGGDRGDTIVIKGRPELEVELRGTNGDLATAAMAVNAIRRVHQASPGLVTMRDLPIVTYF